MSTTDQLLDAIHSALSPERFLSQLELSEEGRLFLSGERDTVPLTRDFLDSESLIAREGLQALGELGRRLAGL